MASTTARAVLGTLVLLLLCSVAPAVLGWETTVVLSGSMEPAVQPGDVTVVRPVPVAQLAVGDVLLVDDPDSPGQLRLHRLVELTGSGLQLKGDANPTADPQLVAASAVHGVGVLGLPRIGLPVLWIAEGRALPLAATAAAIALLVALALADRASQEVGGAPSATTGRRARRLRRTGSVAGSAVAVGLVALLGVVPGLSAAGATFTATTANDANGFAAAAYFSCAAAGSGAPAYFSFQETSGTTANNSGTAGSSVNGTYSGPTPTSSGPSACGAGGTRAMKFDGTNDVMYTSYALSGPQNFTVQMWFTTTTGNGGKLIGFGNGSYGAASSSYDRHVYMTNSGKITFGVSDGSSVYTVTSSNSYNDGAWHLVTATYSPSTYAQLYVDGALIGTRKGMTSLVSYTGYWRVGYDTISDAWPGTPRSDWFAGSIAHVSVYQSALTATAIADQYVAGS